MTARREVIPRSYAVEDPEGLSDLVFRVLVRILLGHHREEGGKLEITRGIFVQCVHHVLQKGKVSRKKGCMHTYQREASLQTQSLQDM